MPSPVKNGLFAPPPAPKPAAGDDARADIFREELSRKQSASGATGGGAALVRKPETKPPGRRQPAKPGRPLRAGGGGDELPQVRATDETDDAATPENTSVGEEHSEDFEDGDAVVTSGEDETAGGATAEAASPDSSATSMAVAPLVAAPPARTGEVAADGGESADGVEDDSNVPAAVVTPVVIPPVSASTTDASVDSLNGLSDDAKPVGSDAPVGHAPRRASVSALFGEASRDVQSDAKGGGEAKAQAAAEAASVSGAVPGTGAGVEDGSGADGARSPVATPVVHTSSSSVNDFTAAQATVAPTVAGRDPSHAAPGLAQQPAALPSEARFAATNHENIVTSMRAELLPNGGTMRLRLDPPQLGTMNVTVQIQDGLITAAFETSSDEATRLLGHSLNQLKSVLESSGIGVDRLQVTQAPREAQPSNAHGDTRHDQGGSQSQDHEQSARQEQQRREMLRRMWRRLTGEPDPLDLTA